MCENIILRNIQGKSIFNLEKLVKFVGEKRLFATWQIVFRRNVSLPLAAILAQSVREGVPAVHAAHADREQ